jgi:formylglycine-generating enzyme required for sulfatase activity
MLYVVRVAALICCAFTFLATASAEKRVALVIGNADYKIGRLANPLNDAEAVAEALEKQLKFDKVLLRKNLAAEAFRAALREMARESAGAELGVIYFAGHGIEVAGRNYLIPVDAALGAARDIELEAVALDTVLGQLDGVRKLRLVILDACRSNPFAVRGAKRSVTRGLVRYEPEGNNTLVAYAAKDGTTADDGKGPHSPFTEALLKHIATPGLEINFVFRRVSDDVLAATNRQQEPYLYGRLGGKEIMLVPAAVKTTPLPVLPPVPPGVGAPKPAADAPPPPQPSEAERAWNAAKDTTSIALLEAYIGRFGDTFYGDLAKTRLTELKHAEATKQAAEAAKKKVEDDARAKEAGVTWDRIKDTTSIAALEQFRRLYGPGSPVYDRLAEARIAEMKKLAMVAPPVVKPEPPKAMPPAATVAPDPALKPGRVFRDCADVCPEMVVVPAGTFTMGSWYNSAEKPPHQVSIQRPFAVGKFEVTRGEFATFVRETGGSVGDKCHTLDGGKWQERSGRSFRNPGFQQDDRHPAACISWEDAIDYVGWLSRKTDKTYRLLTEAEWEYAARAGTTTHYAFGDSISKSQAQFSENSWGRAGKTVRVGSFEPNAFGLYDMHGNILEWVQDCWNDSYNGAPADGSAWTSGDCNFRLLRGGSWLDTRIGVGSPVRYFISTGHRSSGLGFRVARTL